MSSSTSVPEIPPPGEKPSARHEDRDVNLRAIAYFLLALFLLAIAGHTGLYALFKVLIERDAQSDPPLSPLQVEAPRLPPPPRLQSYPEQDLRMLRAREDAILDGYGKSPDGSIHIPIAEAIKLTAQRGLPVRPNAPAEPQPAAMPQESTTWRAPQ